MLSYPVSNNMLCYTILNHAITRCVMLYYAVLCYPVLYCTITQQPFAHAGFSSKILNLFTKANQYSKTEKKRRRGGKWLSERMCNISRSTTVMSSFFLYKSILKKQLCHRQPKTTQVMREEDHEGGRGEDKNRWEMYKKCLKWVRAWCQKSLPDMRNLK